MQKQDAVELGGKFKFWGTPHELNNNYVTRTSFQKLFILLALKPPVLSNLVAATELKALSFLRALDEICLNQDAANRFNALYNESA